MTEEEFHIRAKESNVMDSLYIDDFWLQIHRTGYREWRDDGYPYADQRILPLLEYLNGLDGVATRWSCEGHYDSDDPKMYIQMVVTKEGFAEIERLVNYMRSHRSMYRLFAWDLQLVSSIRISVMPYTIPVWTITADFFYNLNQPDELDDAQREAAFVSIRDEFFTIINEYINPSR